MTLNRNKNKANSNNNQSKFFIQPEEAARLGFSIDDVVTDEMTQPASHFPSWVGLWLVPLMFAVLLAGILGLLRGQVNELKQQLAMGNTEIAAITQRLNSVTPVPLTPPLKVQNPSSPETKLGLTNVIIDSDVDSLTANGRDTAQLTITLQDNSGATYKTTTQIVASVEGAGTLYANGREINNVPINVENGTHTIQYQAGSQPGSVTIHVKVEESNIEQTRLLDLEPILPQRIELKFDPADSPLVANGETRTTLLIKLFDEANELIEGTSEVLVNVDRADLINIISPEPSYIAQNGELSLEVKANSGLVEPVTVNFAISVGEQSEGISLNLVPNSLAPDLKARLGFLCTVRDNNKTTRLYRSKDGGVADVVLDIPVSSEVGCLESTDFLTDSTVIMWLPEMGLNRGITNTLTLTQPITVSLGVEAPSSGEGAPVELDINANGMQVEPTGRQDGEFIEVYINGWMVTAVLEIKE